MGTPAIRPRPRHRRPRTPGFTLIELLLVVAILGISMAVIMPRLGGLIDGGQVAVASRVVTQAGRYSRSMALLNQMPIDLVLNLNGAEVAVEAVQASSDPQGGVGGFGDIYGMGSSGAGGGSVAFGLAQSRNDRDESQLLLGLRTPSEPDPQSPDVVPGGQDEGGLAAEIGLRRKLEGVSLGFGGFQDRSDLSGAGSTTSGVVRVRYRANGTCRPYLVAVTGARTGERMWISVDAVGTPTLSRPGDPPPGGFQ